MLKRIEMTIVYYNVLIDVDENHCYINNKDCPLREDDIDNIIRIIRDWNPFYQNNKIIGENHDSIHIIDNEKEYHYQFQNQFPNNFYQLVEYIGGIYDR